MVVDGAGIPVDKPGVGSAGRVVGVLGRVGTGVVLVEVGTAVEGTVGSLGLVGVFEPIAGTIGSGIRLIVGVVAVVVPGRLGNLLAVAEVRIAGDQMPE